MMLVRMGGFSSVSGSKSYASMLVDDSGKEWEGKGEGNKHDKEKDRTVYFHVFIYNS